MLFEYPKRPLQITGTLIALLLLPLLLFVTALMGGDVGGMFGKGVGGALIMLAAILFAIILHELVHGLFFRLFGYDVSYGVNLKLVAAYAAAFGQFQKRNHIIPVALAPLLLLTLLFLPLLGAADTAVSLIAFTGLLFNSSGAVGDLYLIWRLLHLPPSSLLYDMDAATMLIYLPLHHTCQ